MSTFKLLLLAATALGIAACSTQKSSTGETALLIETKPDVSGKIITVEVQQGPGFKHPLIAIWTEKENGDFLQTLYVSKSFATGVFRYGVMEDGAWKKGTRRHPSALPYFSHKFGNKTTDGLYLPTKENPIPDAVSGATPSGSFTLKAKSAVAFKRYKILMEINQPWDFNNYWFNDKFPGDEEYLASGQPALVYAIDVDTDNADKVYYLQPIGISSYNGSNGNLNPDISSLTTAFKMVQKVKVTVE